jgi:hypothetical protein
MPLLHIDRPCGNCPFRREGGIPLHPTRIEQIAGNMLNVSGGSFPCHKTTGVDGRKCKRGDQHCAGALIFAEKNDTCTNWMRVMERIGGYDRTVLRGHDDVFDDMDEMLEKGSLR